MNRVTKKLACAVMAGVMGTGLLAGCGSSLDGTKALITCGEDTVSVGTGNMMLRMNQAQMQSYYAMMGGSTTGIWSLDGTKALITCGEDTVSVGTGNMMLRMNQAQMQSYYAMMGGSTTGIWDQDAGDGTTYGESTKNMIVQQLKNMVLLKQHADEYEVSVTDEEQKKIEESAKAFVEANTEETLTKLSVTEDDIENLLLLYTYEVSVTDEEQKKIEESAKAFVEANTEETLTKLSVTEDDIENLLLLYTYQEKM